jgi:hypothetical protein
VEFTRIDLFRSWDRRSTNFAVTRWSGTPTSAALVLVSDVEQLDLQFQGGFSEAFVKAWRMSPPGETGLVQVHERDKRQEWRVVNSYPVQFPRRAWVRPAEWDRGRS